MSSICCSKPSLVRFCEVCRMSSICCSEFGPICELLGFNISSRFAVMDMPRKNASVALPITLNYWKQKQGEGSWEKENDKSKALETVLDTWEPKAASAITNCSLILNMAGGAASLISELAHLIMVEANVTSLARLGFHDVTLAM
ncbi:hypothetical protein VNO77_23152 [Canavalia gladiata]|uniref:Uncharacterized protein n=1 Tax=Canavalia gladiata TaxID=3824 RepID=A0AAN9L796_CANGL